MACHTCALSPMALPRTSSSATGSFWPFLCSTIALTLMPPVLRSMRSVSSTKLSCSVPISVSALQNRSSRGSSLAGTFCRGSATSAYSTLDVKRSCVRKVAPLEDEETSVGMVAAARGRSCKVREGMDASASGLSGVSCRFLSSCASAHNVSRGSGAKHKHLTSAHLPKV